MTYNGNGTEDDPIDLTDDHNDASSIFDNEQVSLADRKEERFFF